MAKFIDITGKTFGEWTVLSYAGNRFWNCRCSCGTTRMVLGGDLRHNKSKSCGHSVNSFDDLTGRKFGYWLVIKYAGDRKWECKCICGETRQVNGQNLKYGVTKSCGCIKDTFVDLTGKQFGELTALHWLGKGIWECKCSCGETVKIYGSNLRRTFGGTRSCGCKFYENGSYTRIKNRTTQFRNENQIARASSKENLIAYIETFENKPTVKKLSRGLGLTTSGTLDKIHKYNLIDYIDLKPVVSDTEDEIADFICENTTEDIIRNDRKLLDGLELDVYIESKRLAVEFNGTYWHNYSVKGKNYHQNKSIECAKRGVHLIHIFEHEWENIIYREKLISLLKRELNNNEGYTRIYGRNTKVYDIENSVAVDFCNKYHLQNGISSSINIGLFSGKELVGVMTFGKPRFDTSRQWELLRLCFKDRVSIIGGAEKLFKYFLLKYNPESVVSYCNTSKFRGRVYSRLGFKADKLTEPNYVWVDSQNNVMSRYQTQKHKLVALGLGDDKDTENTIMSGLGYYKLYDSGNVRFIWSK